MDTRNFKLFFIWRRIQVLIALVLLICWFINSAHAMRPQQSLEECNIALGERASQIGLRGTGDNGTGKMPEGGTAHEVEMFLSPALSAFIVPKDLQALTRISKVHRLNISSFDEWHALSPALKYRIQRMRIAAEHRHLWVGRTLQTVADDPPSRDWSFEASITVDGTSLAFQKDVAICTLQEADRIEVRLVQSNFPPGQIVDAIWQFQLRHNIKVTSQHFHQLLPLPAWMSREISNVEAAGQSLALWDRLLQLETLLQMVSIVEKRHGRAGGISLRICSTGCPFCPLTATDFLNFGHLFGFGYCENAGDSAVPSQLIMGFVAPRLPHLVRKNMTTDSEDSEGAPNSFAFERLREMYFTKGYWGVEHRYINPNRPKDQTMAVIAAISQAAESLFNREADKQELSGIARFIGILKRSHFREDLHYEMWRFVSRFESARLGITFAPEAASETFLERTDKSKNILHPELIHAFAMSFNPIKTGWSSFPNAKVIHEEFVTDFLGYCDRHAKLQSKVLLDAVALWGAMSFSAGSENKSPMTIYDVTHQLLFHRWADDERLFNPYEANVAALRKKVVDLQVVAIEALDFHVEKYLALAPEEKPRHFGAFLKVSREIVRLFLMGSGLYERTLLRFGLDPNLFSLGLAEI